MNSRSCFFLASIALAASIFTGSLIAMERSADQLEKPTHRQIRTIQPKLDGEVVTLHTITTTPDGFIVAGLGGDSMSYEMNEDGTDYKLKLLQQASAVVLLDHEGNEVKRHDVDITPTALAVASDGTIYVGGSGKICKISTDGEISEPMDSPHAANPDELRKQIIKAIKESRESMVESFDDQIEMLSDQIELIEAKDEGDRSRLENSQLEAFKMQLKAIEEFAEAQSDGDSDDGKAKNDGPTEEEIEAGMQRALSITSMAISDKDLFICVADPSYAYNVWRLDRDLSADSEPVKVLGDLSGCCGQMDIQCCEDKLVVSENTRFKVGIYDRDGELQSDFGGRDRTSRAGFGSCCNPMNSLPLADGTILTAESSIGHIKRFDQEGNLVSYIGKAKIGGGCKHCSLGHDAEKDLYFMMYQDQNAICVLANIESAPVSEDEKKLAAHADEFYGKIAGHWVHESVKGKSEKSGGFLSSLFGGGRGSESPFPVASIKIEANGDAKILAGMYQAYGDDCKIELMGPDEIVGAQEIPAGATAIALSIDQTRFLTGSWKLNNENESVIAFDGVEPITLQRETGEACESTEAQGAKPATLTLANSSSAKNEIATNSDDPLAVAASLLQTPQASSSGSQPKMEASTITIASTTLGSLKWQYRLISPADFETGGEEKLNELGAEGWEYCGRLGEKMMFKQMSTQALIRSAE
jgi:hypothetical protein